MRIIVYDDSPVFGGHQAMACHGVEALAADPAHEVVVMINPANRRLAERLSEAGIPACPAQAGMPAPRPDLMLCIQGDIGQSAKGVRAARRAGIECVSYIALPHRMADMGARLGALRDGFNHRLLDLPDRFICISESMKTLLIERGCSKPISVVPNGVSLPSRDGESGVRGQGSEIPDPTSRTTLGLLGRVEFKQKRQDFMVRTFIDHPEAFQGCRLLIAGNGPDEARLSKMVSGAENITLLPWQTHAEDFYRQVDFLVIPSRYEGVPLVMLEALALGIPVLGSACDGMKDVLPEAWTFEPGNSEALAATFSSVRESWQDRIDLLRQKILADHTLENFKTNFRSAVCASL